MSDSQIFAFEEIEPIGGTGIPGSGGNVPGKRYLRKDWEYVVCFKKVGGIPYDHPEVMGHEPVTDARTKEWADDTWRTASRGGSGIGGRTKHGRKKAGPTRRKSGEYKAVERDMPPAPVHDAEGNIARTNGRRPLPKIANPGNVLPLVVKARVGGGHIGNRLAHENEAPFPEQLAEFFVRSFCPPGGRVLDCFCGSGTTGAVSLSWGREFWGCDIRQSQVELARRRIAGETPTLFPEAL